MKAVKTAIFEKTEYGKQFANYFEDIFECWPVLLASTGVALVLGYIYLFVMRCLGGAIVWFMIILTELSLLALGGYTYYIRYSRYTPTDQPIHKYLAIAAYVVWGIAGVILIATCCCCGAIRLGIAVMKATAKFIADNLRIFILPFISYVFVSIWICLWFVGASYMYTVGYA